MEFRLWINLGDVIQEVERIYLNSGIRRARELPLRIEIDQFFNYLRDQHCGGDRYAEAPPKRQFAAIHRRIARLHDPQPLASGTVR